MGMGAVAGATLGAGALSAGASVLGGSMSSSAAKSAAAQQKQMYYQTRADLAPFVGAGGNVLGQMTDLATSGPFGGLPNYLGVAGQMFPGGGTGQGGFTQAELEATPGYQFIRDQGLKAVQSAAAARGLGMSGASLKGAATYATGLADKTYLDQFDVQNKRFADVLNLNTAEQNILGGQYTRLHDTAALGENAAAQTGTAGTAAANAAGQYLNQAGLAQAAGTTGATNALTGAVNSYLGYQNFQDLLNRFGPGGGGTQGLTAAGSAGTFAPGATAAGYTLAPGWSGG